MRAADVRAEEERADQAEREGDEPERVLREQHDQQGDEGDERSEQVIGLAVVAGRPPERDDDLRRRLRLDVLDGLLRLASGALFVERRFSHGGSLAQRRPIRVGRCAWTS